MIKHLLKICTTPRFLQGLFAITSLSFSLQTTSYAQFFDFKREVAPPCPRLCVLHGGFYTGSNIGYDSFHARNSYYFNFNGTTFLNGNPPLFGSGLMAGIFVGYGHYFFREYYLGLEAYGNYLGQEASFVGQSEDNFYRGKVRATNNFGISLLPGIRLNPTTTAYLRAGLNVGHFDTHFFATTTSITPALSAELSDSKHKNSFQIGLGIESLFEESWSLRLEYRYNRFQQIGKQITLPNSQGFSKFHGANSEILLGVIYHFCYWP